MDLVRNLLETSLRSMDTQAREFGRRGFDDPFWNEMMAMQFLNSCRSYISFMHSHRIQQSDFYKVCRDVEERQLVDEFFLMLHHVQNNDEYLACLIAKELIKKKIGDLNG